MSPLFLAVAHHVRDYVLTYPFPAPLDFPWNRMAGYSFHVYDFATACVAGRLIHNLCKNVLVVHGRGWTQRGWKGLGEPLIDK